MWGVGYFFASEKLGPTGGSIPILMDSKKVGLLWRGQRGSRIGHTEAEALPREPREATMKPLNHGCKDIIDSMIIIYIVEY